MVCSSHGCVLAESVWPAHRSTTGWLPAWTAGAGPPPRPAPAAVTRTQARSVHAPRATQISSAGVTHRARIVSPERERWGSALGAAGGEAGDVVVHEKNVQQDRGQAGKQRAGHEPAPVVDVALG